MTLLLGDPRVEVLRARPHDIDGNIKGIRHQRTEPLPERQEIAYCGTALLWPRS